MARDQPVAPPHHAVDQRHRSEIAKTAEEIRLLAVSFHATEDAVRDRLVPVNKKWNIETLLERAARLSAPVELRTHHL